jgi:general secretion pathway protein K
MKAAQRGAALLAAMLTVALVATFAASAVWQQWRSTEVEAAERARVQSAWVLSGALDWARLVLREDARSGGADHLGEPWAVPLQEARLSSFLAAERNASTADTGPEMLEAFLSGQITDMQSLLNVTNLIENGKISEADLRSFQRLFELLSLPPAELDRLAENLRFASDTSASNRSGSSAPLLPQATEQLVWLGISPEIVAALQPYVTVLPRRTLVNLNTASAEVIYSSVDGLNLADAQRLVAERERSPFRSTEDARRLVAGSDPRSGPSLGSVGVASQYFEIRSRLRLDQLVVEERALVQRDGFEVRTLQRQRSAGNAATMAPAGGTR